MAVFLAFGPVIEREIGTRRFLKYFLFMGLVGAFTPFTLQGLGLPVRLQFVVWWGSWWSAFTSNG